MIRSITRVGCSLSRLAPIVETQLASTSTRHVQSYEWAPDWDLTPQYNDGKLVPARTNPTADKWNHYAQVIWPPNFQQDSDGGPKVAELFHCRENLKYSPKKMWYVCEFVRGRNIDEALTQLEFVPRKGAQLMIEVLKEARELAPENHIEYASNMWIAEAFPTPGMVIKGYRRHKGGNPGQVEYRYCNVFIRLEEGTAPDREQLRRFPRETSWQKMEDYIKQLRGRTIHYGL